MAKKQSFDVETLKKHHYWIVTGLAGLALPICWFLAVGSLSETFNKDKAARDSTRQKVETFVPATQPNTLINQELQNRHERLTAEVFRAWKWQFDRQQPYVDWDLKDMWSPPLLAQLRTLDPAYARAFEDARLKGAELPSELRNAYASWLRTPHGLSDDPDRTHVQFEHVYKFIGLREPIAPRDDTKEQDAGTGKAGEAAKAAFDQKAQERPSGAQWDGLVVWPLSEREYLEAKFGKGQAWLQGPTTAQVVYTHESMNVYALLLYFVVASTNGDQTEHQLLAIKKIVTLRIGEDCQLPPKGTGDATAQPGAPQGKSGYGPGTVGLSAGGAGGGYGPGAGNLPGSGGEQMGPQDPTAPFVVDTLSLGGGRGSEGFGGGGGATTNTDRGPSLADGTFRYVDDEGYALPDPKQQPYAEFRMLPVTMRFIMDQRKLPELLARCVESPLPIEVRQWSLRDPRNPTSGRRQAGGGGRSGGGMDFSSGIRDKMGAKAGGGDGMALGAVQGGGAGNEKAADEQRSDGASFGGEIELGPYDREVEIKGVIYIYNPPDQAKVGTGSAGLPGQPLDGKQPDGKPADVKQPEAKVAPDEKTAEPPLAAPGAAGKTQPEKTPAEKTPAPKNNAPQDALPEKVGEPLPKEPATPASPAAEAAPKTLPAKTQ